MTNLEKTEFISKLIDSVKKELIKDVDKMPGDWNGIELRLLIKERFDQEVDWAPSKKTMKEFHNECYKANI